MARADVGGGAAAKVDKVQRPVFDRRLLRVVFHLAGEGVEIGLDLLAVFVRVNAEVAELAALAAEGDVEIEAELGVGSRWVSECAVCLRDVLFTPKRIGRIVGNKDAADLGFGAVGAGGSWVAAEWTHGL